MLRLGAIEGEVSVGELLPEFAGKFGEISVDVAGRQARLLSVRFTAVEQQGQEFRMSYFVRDPAGTEDPRCREIRIASAAAKALRFDTCSIVHAGNTMLILPAPHYRKVV